MVNTCLPAVQPSIFCGMPPPHPHVAPRRALLWCEARVVVPVPLCCHLGVPGSQRVAGAHLPAGTEGAPRSCESLIHCGLPFVGVLTCGTGAQPPVSLVADGVPRLSPISEMSMIPCCQLRRLRRFQAGAALHHSHQLPQISTPRSLPSLVLQPMRACKEQLRCSISMHLSATVKTGYLSHESFSPPAMDTGGCLHMRAKKLRMTCKAAV